MPVIISIVVLIIALGAGSLFFRNEETTPETVTPENLSTPVETARKEETTSQTTYADGTYHGTGTYDSPAGAETVDVSITLTGDVVTAASFEGHAENPGSVMNQGKFARGYTAFVVGKKLDEISLTVVNGSSLTPVGFMKALTEIKAEARS